MFSQLPAHWDVSRTCKEDKHSSDITVSWTGCWLNSKYFYLGYFPSEKQLGTHRSGTSGKTNQYCSSFRKHHKITCHYRTSIWKYWSNMKDSPCSEQLSWEPGYSRVTDKKKRKQMWYWKLLKSSVLNKFNCLSIALACCILSELSVYLMLNFLLYLITFWNPRGPQYTQYPMPINSILSTCYMVSSPFINFVWISHLIISFHPTLILYHKKQ